MSKRIANVFILGNTEQKPAGLTKYTWRVGQIFYDKPATSLKNSADVAHSMSGCCSTSVECMKRGISNLSKVKWRSFWLALKTLKVWMKQILEYLKNQYISAPRTQYLVLKNRHWRYYLLVEQRARCVLCTDLCARLQMSRNSATRLY